MDILALLCYHIDVLCDICRMMTSADLLFESHRLAIENKDLSEIIQE